MERRKTVWAHVGGWTGMALLMLTVFGYAINRIKKLEENSMTEKMCLERCNAIKARLDR